MMMLTRRVCQPILFAIPAATAGRRIFQTQGGRDVTDISTGKRHYRWIRVNTPQYYSARSEAKTLIFESGRSPSPLRLKFGYGSQGSGTGHSEGSASIFKFGVPACSSPRAFSTRPLDSIFALLCGNRHYAKFDHKLLIINDLTTCAQ